MEEAVFGPEADLLASCFCKMELKLSSFCMVSAGELPEADDDLGIAR